MPIFTGTAAGRPVTWSHPVKNWRATSRSMTAFTERSMLIAEGA